MINYGIDTFPWWKNVLHKKKSVLHTVQLQIGEHEVIRLNYFFLNLFETPGTPYIPVDVLPD